MNKERLIDIIESSHLLTAQTSLPVYLSEYDAVVWFQFSYDMSSFMCLCQKVFFYAPSKDSLMQATVDINAHMYPDEDDIELMEDDDYIQAFDQAKDVEAALELVRHTDSHVFLNLYKEVIEYVIKALN